MGFVYCLIYLAIMSITVFLVGRFYPRKWILENSFPFRSFAFEKDGKIYEKIGIRKWKTVWPDASRILHGLFPKHYPEKRMENKDIEKVPVLIKESCIAEGTHAIAGVLGLVCMAVWRGIGGIIISIVYFLVQIPPIIIQRYNRPRLKKSLQLAKIRQKKEFVIKYEETEKGAMPEYYGEAIPS